jgi:hypothetical protein
MSQAPTDKSDQPATERAEAILDNLGRRLGLFAGSVGQRIQNAATSVREGADRLGQQNTASGQRTSPFAHGGEQNGQVMERSEELVDRAAQRLSQYALRAGYQIQKATARLREEAEDMWAEAQNIRQENSRKPQ